MARATTPGPIPRPDLVYKAICARRIVWKDSAARNMQQDRRTKGFTRSGVAEWLHTYALYSGPKCVKERAETREYWLEVNPDDPWWYKVNIEFEDYPARLFVELKLSDPDDEQDPCVEIVNCHF
jgi:hypothetical protein